jgi:hypothetical protein
MSFRSLPLLTRRSPFRVIAGLIFAALVVAGMLSFRLLNVNRALAANTTRRRSAAADIHGQSADGLWSFVAETDSQAAAQIASAYRSYRKLKLNRDAFTITLAKAPLETVNKPGTVQPIITLPQADGTFMRFSFVESPIMAPELAARYPEIKTYLGQGIEDPAATARFDWTTTGFHAIVVATGGTSLIEPATLGDVANYVVFHRAM